MKSSQVRRLSPRKPINGSGREGNHGCSAEERLQQLSWFLGAIRGINHLIVHEREPQALLNQACDLLVQTRGYALVWVGLVDAPSTRLRPTARAGSEAAYLDEIASVWDETPEVISPCAMAIHKRKPCLCQDASREKNYGRWRAVTLAHKLASSAAIPLLYGDRVLGVLAVYSHQKDAFPEDEIGLLEEVAEDLAFALQSMEQRQGSARAAEQLHLVNSALQASANAIAITDTAGVIQWVNPAFSQLTGYLPEELRGRTPRMLRSGLHDQAFYHGLWDTVMAGRVWRAEMINRRKDGSLYTEENTITPVRNESGQVTHFIAVKQDISDRKRAEAAREESERFAYSTLDSLSAHVAIVDQKGVIVAVNHAWRQFAEQNPPVKSRVCEGANYLAVCDAATGEDMPTARMFAAGIREVLAGRQGEFSMEYACHSPSQRRWFAGRVTRFLGDGPVRAVVAHENITARKEAELRITAFATLGERLSGARTYEEAARVIVDVADKLLGWDTCVFDRYSAAEDELRLVLGMDIINGCRADCLPVGEELEPSPLARRAIEQGGQLVLRNETTPPDAETRPFGDTSRRSAALLYVPVRHGSEVLGLVCIASYTPNAYDQHSLQTLQALADHCGGTFARIRTEEQLRLSASRFRSVWDNSVDGMRLTDRNGLILEVNEAFCRLVKLPREKLVGQPYTCCYREATSVGLLEEYRQKFAAGTVPAHLSTQVQWWNGEVVDLEISTSFIDLASQGQAQLSIFRDTTVRRHLESQLRQSQKMEGIGQLAGGVAHDFNNMLAVIRGNAELLLMDDTASTPAREFLKHITAAAERAANLTRQLLIFSRRQLMQPQPVAMNELIANLTKMLKRIIREDVELACNFCEPSPFVQADPGMLEQVVMNLVVNARDAMPHGGKILVSTEGVRLDAEAVRANPQAREGEFVCLSVRDTGVGIPPDVMPRIFEPFFTTKEIGRGTGLGLATVYGIVQQHQGWVEVSSQVGQGTILRVFLPAIPAPTAAVDPAQGQKTIRGGTETILLVEDESPVRIILRRVLESHGYKLIEASSGPQALEAWSKHSADISLLLTDIIMPEGITGRELSERLRADKPWLKVVFLSGYNPDAIGGDTEFVHQSHTHFLQKPCTGEVLLQTVRQCLDER